MRATVSLRTGKARTPTKDVAKGASAKRKPYRSASLRLQTRRILTVRDDR
jgi:hypothetical protein